MPILPILPLFFLVVDFIFFFLLLFISILFNVKCLCNCSWSQEWEEGLRWDDTHFPIQSTRVLRDDVRESHIALLLYVPLVDVYKNRRGSLITPHFGLI